MRTIPASYSDPLIIGANFNKDLQNKAAIDNPEHARIIQVIMRHLSPQQLAEIKTEIAEAIDQQIAEIKQEAYKAIEARKQQPSDSVDTKTLLKTNALGDANFNKDLQNKASIDNPEHTRVIQAIMRHLSPQQLAEIKTEIAEAIDQQIAEIKQEAYKAIEARKQLPSDTADTKTLLKTNALGDVNFNKDLQNKASLDQQIAELKQEAYKAIETKKQLL